MRPMQALRLASAILVLSLFLGLMPAVLFAQNVTITPLGSHDGEFCRYDRAMILEDPSGTRILYDAGRTVAGPKDPRLGKIDVVLVSHMHGDHVGDRHLAEVNAGECGQPDVSVMATPNTSSVNIVLAKNAKIITGSEMPKFFAGKLAALGGDPDASQLVRFGGSCTVAANRQRSADPGCIWSMPGA